MWCRVSSTMEFPVQGLLFGGADNRFRSSLSSRWLKQSHHQCYWSLPGQRESQDNPCVNLKHMLGKQTGFISHLQTYCKYGYQGLILSIDVWKRLWEGGLEACIQIICLLLLGEGFSWRMRIGIGFSWMLWIFSRSKSSHYRGAGMFRHTGLHRRFHFSLRRALRGAGGLREFDWDFILRGWAAVEITSWKYGWIQIKPGQQKGGLTGLGGDSELTAWKSRARGFMRTVLLLSCTYCLGHE